MAREEFGKKEEGTKKDGAERREGEYHPPTQTLTSQEWRLRVCVCVGGWGGEGRGAREAFGKKEEGERRTGRKKRRRITPARPETKEP